MGFEPNHPARFRHSSAPARVSTRVLGAGMPAVTSQQPVIGDCSPLWAVLYHIETHLTYSARQMTGVQKNVFLYDNVQVRWDSNPQSLSCNSNRFPFGAGLRVPLRPSCLPISSRSYSSLPYRNTLGADQALTGIEPATPESRAVTNKPMRLVWMCFYMVGAQRIELWFTG